MSNPRYPKLTQCDVQQKPTPRRRLLGLSLLAAVSLAPKCGAMPYRAMETDWYQTDQARVPDQSRSDASGDLAGELTSDTTEELSGGADLVQETLEGDQAELQTGDLPESPRGDAASRE